MILNSKFEESSVHQKKNNQQRKSIKSRTGRDVVKPVIY